MALGALTLACLVVVIPDLVKVVIDIDDHGVTVNRMLPGFAARLSAMALAILAHGLWRSSWSRRP